MTERANAGDRIILFTLVDLLIQIIFCGFLLFAANRAAQGNIQDQIGLLARKFGVVSVTRFLDATSKLVAIADLGRVDVLPASDKSTTLFHDATKMLQGLSQDDLSVLAKMNPQQLRTFTRTYAALAPAERQQLSTFINRFGIGVMKEVMNGDLTAKQLRTLLETLSRLPPQDRDKFGYLAVAFANADPAKRQKIVEATAVLARPTCFDRRQALHITEVPNGYLVRPLIAPAAADASRILSSHGAVGQTYRLTESEFWRFSGAFTAAHASCTIRVLQDTTTYDERQLKRIQYWYATW